MDGSSPIAGRPAMQQTFVDANFEPYRKSTRRKRFLTEQGL